MLGIGVGGLLLDTVEDLLHKKDQLHFTVE